MYYIIFFHDRVQSVFKCPDDNLGLLYHNGTLVIFRHAANTFQVNIATSWMISKITRRHISRCG